MHGLKYQAIVAPNGLIANLFGPYEGCRHDAAMLVDSGVLQHLQNLHDNNGQQLCVYGDLAFLLRPELITQYKGANLTAVEKDFNKAMSKVRESVEWSFGQISTLWAFLTSKRIKKYFGNQLENITL